MFGAMPENFGHPAALFYDFFFFFDVSCSLKSQFSDSLAFWGWAVGRGEAHATSPAGCIKEVCRQVLQ